MEVCHTVSAGCELQHHRCYMYILPPSACPQNGGAVIGGSNAVLPNSSLQKLSTGGTAGGSSDADLVCNAIRSFNSSTSVTKAMISQTLNGRLGGTKIE